jgi:hypothetical protein
MTLHNHLSQITIRRRGWRGQLLSSLAGLLAFLSLASLAYGQRLMPGPEQNTLAASPNGLGAKRVAAVLFNFADNPVRPISAEDTRRQLFTDSDSTNAFVNEVSFGQLSMVGHLRSDGDIFGWYTLPLTGSATDKHTPSRVAEINRMAQADGFNVANYDVIFYIHPFMNSGWAGQAYGGSSGKEIEMDGMNRQAAAHELFHILGLDHANGIRCTQNGVPAAIADNFTIVGYGDPFDSQGANGYRHPNAYFKARMGWFMTYNFRTLARGSNQTHTLQIAPIERPSSGLLCVRIPIPSNRIRLQYPWGADPNTVELFYYLEYRQPSTYDPYSPGDPVVNGVSIRLGTDIDTNHMTMLVDTSPETADFNDAPLTVGETFRDAFSGVTIRTLATSSAGATVEITLSESGNLLWYKHEGQGDGVSRWANGSGGRVGHGWQDFLSVFSTDDGVIYGIKPNGDLLWYKHEGREDGVNRWAKGSGAVVGNGWAGFRSVFAASDGVIYAINTSGELLWFKHDGWTDGTRRWANSGAPRVVGRGWGGIRSIFAAGDGVIYAIGTYGDLLWYKHEGRTDGTVRWANSGAPRLVGRGWGGTRSVFAASGGVIYAINTSGDLLWYKHEGWTDGTVRWANAGAARLVGRGWGGIRSAFATSDCVIYGIVQ